MQRRCSEDLNNAARGEYFSKKRGADRQRNEAEDNRLVAFYNFMDVGAADKAAIQLVEDQPYQLLVSDT